MRKSDMKHQQGSTLIVVLIVLLLITLIGTMAMRESLLNLRLSTTTQVGNLLLSNSDAGLFDLENPNKVRVRLVSQSMFGYFENALNAKDELIFCYVSNRSSIFQLNRASVINNPSKLGPNGYCAENHFSTGREAVISQIYLRQIREEQEPLAPFDKGNEIGANKSAGVKLNLAATVVSVLPSLSTTSYTNIQDCFKRSAVKNENSTAQENVEVCLQEQNIPYNLQYAEFDVEATPKRVS